jgi:RNA recognition motif-containing protein
MTSQLRISNIPRTSTNDEIEALFRPFALVSSVAFAKDPTSELSTGCGTVEMDSDKDAQSAINRLNFSQYGGRTNGVSRARTPCVISSRTDLPSRSQQQRSV